MTATTATPSVTASFVLTQPSRRVGILVEFTNDEHGYGEYDRDLLIHALLKSEYDSHRAIAQQADECEDRTAPVVLNLSAARVYRQVFTDDADLAVQLDELLAADQKQVLAELKAQETTSTDIFGETVRVGTEVVYGAAAGKLTTGKILEIVPATSDVPEYFVVEGAGVTPVIGVIRAPQKKQQAREGARRAWRTREGARRD